MSLRVLISCAASKAMSARCDPDTLLTAFPLSTFSKSDTKSPILSSWKKHGRQAVIQEHPQEEGEVEAEMSLQAARKKQADTVVITYTALHIWYAIASVRENYARAASTSARGERIIFY